MFEIWNTDGSIKIKEHDDLVTCLHHAEILQRQTTVQIRRSDGYVYSWQHRSFYRDRVIKK